MKRNLLVINIFALVLFFVPNASFAQFEGEGSLVANLGLGLGTNLGYGGFPISISADYGVTDAITVGGLLGYNRSSETFTYFFGQSYKYTQTNLLIGARGAYHLDLLDEFDTYGGLMLGYNVISTKIEPDFSDTNIAASGIFLGGFIGINHFFNDQIGAFAELGYGVGYLTIGASFRIK